MKPSAIFTMAAKWNRSWRARAFYVLKLLASRRRRSREDVYHTMVPYNTLIRPPEDLRPPLRTVFLGTRDLVQPIQKAWKAHPLRMMRFDCRRCEWLLLQVCHQSPHPINGHRDFIQEQGKTPRYPP